MLDLERGDDVEEERERGRRRPKAGFRARADARATTLWLELRPRRAPPTPARMCRTEAAGLDHGSPLDGAGGTEAGGEGSRWRRGGERGGEGGARVRAAPGGGGSCPVGWWEGVFAKLMGGNLCKMLFSLLRLEINFSMWVYL
jgi:hypothetical protein